MYASLRRRMGGRSEVQRLYEELPYLEAYREHTDIRVQEDPELAIGGMWDEMGRLQFDYLVDNGLRPDHSMLDIGCGTLRGGRHFIRFLQPGGYTGLDISPKALEAAAALVEEEGLTEKEPHLVLNESLSLTFDELEGRRFDVLLAQSVFTHLPKEEIRTCFQHLHEVVAPGATFFFTYFSAPVPVKRGLKGFAFPATTFERLAEEVGATVETRGDYDHPRSQRMAVLRFDA